MKKKTLKQTHKPQKQTTRKDKRKMQKRKSMSGGRPKINFPYTYFFLEYSDFMKYSATLSPYLIGQTNACDNIASGNQPEFNANSPAPFLSNDNEACALVLKYDVALALDNNKNLLEDINFLNKILGHAKLINYPALRTIGIYNVCLHTFNITRNPQGIITSELKQTKPGYGSVLFNCIYTGMLLLKISFDKIWLGIDVNNVQFEKVAWLYASKGFREPIFSNILPDGTTLPRYFIQLTNHKIYVNNSDDATIHYHETIDLYQQIKYETTQLAAEGIFHIEFAFDKSAILSLRLMPFLSFSETKDVESIGDFNKQRETSGKFITYNSYTYKENEVNYVGYILSLEVRSDSFINYVTGESGGVTPVMSDKGEEIFHTHPFINYKQLNVLIGPPSGQDIAAFLQTTLTYLSKPMTKLPQFSGVISIEGIYIYSLSIYGIKNMIAGIIPDIELIKTSYDYPFSERYYDWNTYSIEPINVQENAVKNGVEKYLHWFNTINSQFGNYFDVVFKPWSDINTETNFRIHYYNGNRIKLNTNTQNI